jgi:hypothetical protein
MTKVVPEVSVNGTPLRTPRPAKKSTPPTTTDVDDTAWGAIFWVTLVDPQVLVFLFAGIGILLIYAWNRLVLLFLRVLPLGK